MNHLKLNYIDVFDDNKEKELVLSKDIIKSDFKEDSLFAVLIDGMSMEPLIKDKSVLVSDLSQKQLVNDAIYLLYFENKMWVKKYNLDNKEFVSINPNFSHLVYKEDEVHLIAKVLLTFTNL